MLARASSSLFRMVPYSQGRVHPSDSKQEKEWAAVIGRRPENATQPFAVLMRGVGKREETCVHSTVYS